MSNYTRRRDWLVAAKALLVAGAAGSMLAVQAKGSTEGAANGAGLKVLPPPPDPIYLLVRRMGYGIAPGEIEAARQAGYNAWLEYQLNPSAINVSDIEAAIAEQLPTVAMTQQQLNQYYAERDGNDIIAGGQLSLASVIRRTYSGRQLYERMVEFWSDHFHTSIDDGLTRRYKTVEDRNVMRVHALGRFRDLLGGSAKSPAMLFYLDNALNRAVGPNENYARELLELHTLGVSGGYSEADVKEVARAFTGWTVNRFGQGDNFFVFSTRDHDYAPKTILGRSFPGGRGIEEGEEVLDMLASHPSTALFLSTKLARRFVSDNPPSTLVDRLAQTFLSSGGDIKTWLRALFGSPEFLASADQKVTRPLDYVIGTIRTLLPFTLPQYYRVIFDVLEILGQRPFAWPAPNGYPDVGPYWVNTSALLNRWNFAFALSNDSLAQGLQIKSLELLGPARSPTAIVDRLAEVVLHRSLSATDRETLIAFVSHGDSATRPLRLTTATVRARALIALLLSSSYFQLR